MPGECPKRLSIDLCAVLSFGELFVVRKILSGKVKLVEKLAKLAKFFCGKGKTFGHTLVIRGPPSIITELKSI